MATCVGDDDGVQPDGADTQHAGEEVADALTRPESQETSRSPVDRECQEKSPQAGETVPEATAETVDKVARGTAPCEAEDQGQKRLRQLQAQQRLQQQMQRRRREEEERRVQDAVSIPPAPPPLPLGMPTMPQEYLVAQIPLQGFAAAPASQGIPPPASAAASEKAWGDFRLAFKQYMVQLADEALQQAPPQVDPRAPRLSANAIGGHSTGQICMSLLNNTCRRGLRCINVHPPRAQWARWRQELKRKQCPKGNHCILPACLYFHPREMEETALTQCRDAEPG
mmetsp:Transcript_37606/g.70136  ORF Transcript_37606/g.70136 Transcript_37606/m.70136 type:complete len:283 (-) Transcript_37606:9-857(-)